MKKLAGIILLAAFTLFAIADSIQEFISSDGIHYFSEQPQRLPVVAVIGIVGGLVALSFSLLSPGLQRGVKLVVVGLGATFAMLGGGYLSFQVASLAMRLDSTTAQLVPDILRHIPWLLLLGTAGIAGLLWFEFYRVLRRCDRVAYHRAGASSDCL